MRRRVPDNDNAPGEFCMAHDCDFSTYAHNVASLRGICETKQCCSFVPEYNNRWALNLPNMHITQQVKIRGEIG